MKKNIVLILILPILVLLSCIKDESDSENLKINKWIYATMEHFYLWNTTISSEMEPEGNTDPKDYFNSILNKPTDKWSVIIDDFSEFSQSMAGNPTSMGYEAVYGTFSNTGNVFAIVKYVYPDTPADNAGLGKGDIILLIDNTELTTDNYQELFGQDSYSLTLGEFRDGTIYTTNQTLNMTAELLDINPAIHHDIFTIEGKKIGYLALTEFISYNNFSEKVSTSIMYFKNNSIQDLIIDLRYNTGGDLNSAIWLGSVLAPLSNTENNDIFVKLIYNETLQAIKDEENESQFSLQFIPELNLDIENIYFLTTNYSTASASELVISGLEPYMNVTQVGENTVGKYQGMNILPHTDMYWAILPVTFKYANANNFTDFGDGLIPDVLIEDDLIAGYDFGDVNDPVISKTIELITGLPARKKTTINALTNFNIRYSNEQKLKMNLFLE